MRPVLFHLWSALTAAGGALGTFAVSQSTLSSTTRLIPVLVGGNSLSFTPNSVTAQPGDVIQFQFAARNHTVTQSDAATPCQPATSGKGVHSGFIPFDGGASGMVGTFDMPVTSTEPMFLYCAQANHCQSGMVMVINGNSEDLISYANSAASVSANTPAKQVLGGVAAQIPLANAIVPTAAASSSSSASRATSQQATNTATTVTRGGGGTATATAFVTVGVGGGTATRFATATVGPSGVAAGGAAAAGAAAAKATGPEGLAGANGTQPQPAVFTGGAAALGGARGKLLDVLVVAGAMSLGTVLITARR